MTGLWQGCDVAFGVLISKSLIEINRFLALDSWRRSATLYN